MIRGVKPEILIVEDDDSICTLITTTLEIEGYKYELAKTGLQALKKAANNQEDIIFMDLGLPDIDGVEVIKKIRQRSQAPIIVISARSEENDKVEALDAGADDYLTKPFSVNELLARLRAITRRVEFLNDLDVKKDSVFKNGKLEINYQSELVTVGEKNIHLMPMEYRILCLLAQNIGKVLTYKFILNKIRASDFESDLASLRVYMTSLRKKLEKDNDEKYIQTHVGVGYRMINVDEEE